MLIQINGEPRELPADCSAGQLISDLKPTSKRIAMEVNGEILPRSQYNEHRHEAGDKMEIVHAVGRG